MKPWERYAKDAQQEQQGPWTQYAAPTTEAAPTPQPERQRSEPLTGLPSESFLERVAMFGPRLLEQSGAKDKITSALTAAKDYVVGKHDDYPEIPTYAWNQPKEMLLHRQVNPAMAKTFEGQFNALKKLYPNAEVAGTDSYGNTLVTLNESLHKELPADQKFYIDKPGLSMFDITKVPKALVQRAIPVVAASVGTGKLTWPLSAATTGLAGYAGSLANQKIAQEYTGEPIDEKSARWEGVLSALGEWGGRAVSSMIAKRATTKAAGEFVKGLPDDAVQQLKSAGIDIDVLGREVVESAQTYVKQGMSPVAAARKAASEKIGAKLTTGQITGDLPQLRAEEIARQSSNPLVNRPMNEQMVGANRALMQKAEDIVAATSGMDDPLYAGTTVRQALKQKKTDMGAEASSLYSKFTNQAGVNTPLPKEATDEFFKQVVPVVDDFRGSIPPDVMKKLQDFGLFGNAKRDLTFGEAEKLNQFLNTFLKGNVPAPQRAAINSIKASLDDALNLSAQGNLMASMKEARGASAAMHKEFSQKDAVQAVITKKAQFTDVIPEERVIDKIVFTGSIDDLFKAKKSLTTGTKTQIEQGTEAWNNLRAATFRKLVDAATSGNAKNTAGEIIFSGAKFNTALKKIGDQKLALLFSPKELESIHQLRLVADAATNFPRGAVNTSYTATFLNTLNRAAENIPGGKYINDVLQLPVVSRALSGNAVTEAARKEMMGKRILPKIGAVYGQEKARRDRINPSP